MKSFQSPRIVLAVALLAASMFSVMPAHALDAADVAQTESAANLSGNWQLTFTGPDGGEHQATLDIRQSGDKLSGSFHGQRGTFSLSGTAHGNQVSLSISAHGRALGFSGTVEGDKMSGSTATGAPWSATR